ncbi:hypoxanthine phosphoribosyltransferase [Planctomicrobium sp. SH527]|uniref:hypoxanthine phosphoribosyltransferase n=1 Tax=Planctomicrobium sp. SH527 TaxID=3448123 RepID=UPI003F5AF638
MTHIRVLLTPETISDSVRKLGQELTEEYSGRDLTILGILTGSIVLVTDLIREIAIPHQLGFIQAKSYRRTETTSGQLQVNFDYLPEIRGRDILLVDDIFDTGRTLSSVREQLEEYGPRSIKTAVLLWKTARREVETIPDYHCFDIPDEFVVGYGLDYDHHYRHLPYIGVLEQASDQKSHE